MSRLYRNANVYIDDSFRKMDFIIDDEGYLKILKRKNYKLLLSIRYNIFIFETPRK